MGIKTILKQHQFSESFLITASTILFFPFVLFLRLIGGTWLASNHHYPSLVQALIISGILFVLWFLSKIFLKRGLALSGIEIYLIPFLAAIALSTVFSTNISLSAEKALGVGVFLGLALMLLEIRKYQWAWEGLINSLLITALFTTVISVFSIFHAMSIFQYSIADIVLSPIQVIKSLPRLPNIRNLHITISAGYYLMVLPLAVYRFLKTDSRLLKVIIFLGGGASGAVFFLIQSRGSLIGLALMVLCVVFLERSQIWALMKKHRSLMIALSMIGILVLALGFGYILERRGFSFTEGSILCRGQSWIISLELIKRFPLFGSGMETFGYQFLELRQSESCSLILHVTHNDVLQVLVNFGLMGMGGLLFFAVRYWSVIKDGLRSGDKHFVYCLPGIAGMIGMGLMTTMLYSPNIRLLLILYLVWMLPVDRIQFRELKPRLLSALLAGFIILGLGSGWMLWKIQPYYQARIAADKGDLSEAVLNVEVALERDPGITYYQQSLAYLKAQGFCTTGLGLGEAVDQYRVSLDQVSILPEDHANLASLLASQGRYTAAAAELHEAIRLNSQNSTFQCMLGEYSYQLGNSQEALDALAECAAGDQAWLDTPYWDDLELALDFENQVVELAREKISEKKGEDKNLLIGKLYYYHGDDVNARVYLDLHLAENPIEYEAFSYQSLLSLRQGNLGEAQEFSQRALDINPRCQICWLVQAESAFKQGDLAKAERASKISIYLQSTPRAQVVLAKLHIENGDRSGAVDALQSATFYAIPPNRYSHWISSRWSLENNHLRCIPAGLTYQDYYLPISEGGAILQELESGLLTTYYENAMAPDKQSRQYFQSFSNEEY